MNTAKLSPEPDSRETPKIDSIARDEKGHLVVKLQGEEPVVEAVVARCFPWSLPDSYVSIRDKKGKEIALLETIEGLDSASRDVIEAEIRDMIFVPKIERITSHAREFGVTSITADTDRGTVTFQVRTRDDIRVLSLTRVLFRDADGNVFDVPDLNLLDPASRRYVEEYL